MDLLTHGLAGAVMAQSAARRVPARLAIAIGFFAGLLADLDILISAADDPLFNIEYHRHFTHSLFFVPLGALGAALVAWPFARRRLRFATIYLLAFLGFLTSGLLDTCTSFGTHWLWPLYGERLAWNIIAIIDPLFTLILLVAVILAWRRDSVWPARVGVGLAVLYLLLGLAQRERAAELATELAAGRGHAVERLEVKPTLGNLVLWRSIYQSGEHFYVDALRIGFLTPARVYPGESVARFAPEHLPELDSDSRLSDDIARFTHFSNGFVALHPQQPDVLGDVRYALLPNSTVPLWGIELDLTQPDRHVAFLTFRQTDAALRRAFLTMLRGRDLEEAPERQRASDE
ncbi:MAG: metal-dependent hydrolase [Candidatus Competibacteraceae bacterium]|nr:MAG: metal-dependent hydrolase [Candidatus Competibacteraceae bacterium]